jgi:hypothetical protein
MWQGSLYDRSKARGQTVKKHLFVIRPDGDMTEFCGDFRQKGGDDPEKGEFGNTLKGEFPDTLREEFSDALKGDQSAVLSSTREKGWFEDEIRELAKLLDDLPPERQDAFMDEIEGNE